MTATPPQLEQLGRRSRQAAVISLVGFLLVIAAIGYSIWQIDRLEDRKRELNAEAVALDAQVKALNKDIEAKRVTLDRISRQIASGDVTAVEKTLVQQAAAPPAPVIAVPRAAGPKEGARPGAAAIVVAAAPAVAEKRVYFQIRSRDQTKQYQACGAILRNAGYRVPQAEYVPDRGPARAEVRYFRDEEGDEARRVAKQLAGCLGGEVAVNLIGGYRDSPLVKPMQFEVWFAPARAPSRAAAAAVRTRPVVTDAYR